MLGFNINFKWEDPPTYVAIKRDDAVGSYLVKKMDRFKPSAAHTSLYIFVNYVDALHTKYLASGANVIHPVGDRDYGMRDFDIRDPNGFILVFGKNMEAS